MGDAPSDRKLLNGYIGLTIGDLFKTVLPLLVMGTTIIMGWANFEAQLKAHGVEIDRLTQITQTREAYISRLISLEREVAAVNERAVRAIDNEARLISVQLNAVISRLDRIERSVGSSPNSPGQRQ